MAGLVAMIFTSCAPLVTSGTDVMIGGGIYPPPVLNPPMGNPNIYRPGGPTGPGFAPGIIVVKPKPNHPSYKPGNPPQVNNPSTYPGNQRPPGTGVNIGNPGNQRPAGTGVNIGSNPGKNPVPPQNNNGGRRPSDSGE